MHSATNNRRENSMRKMVAALAALLALLFAPVLWGLPPPGEQVPAELAWDWAAEHNSKTDEANEAIWMIPSKVTLEAVATEILATTPSTGGVRLLTFKSAFGPGDAFDPPLTERTRGSTRPPAGGARR